MSGRIVVSWFWGNGVLIIEYIIVTTIDKATVENNIENPAAGCSASEVIAVIPARLNFILKGVVVAKLILYFFGSVSLNTTLSLSRE